MKWMRQWLGLDPKAPSVSASLRKEENGIHTLRIGGTLNKATLDNVQSAARRGIAAGAKDLKVLLILQDFRGWKRGDDWGDLDFFGQHEADVAKIAVVGEDRWEEEALLFLGAGRRQGEVRFFPLHHEGKARAWLAG